MRSVGVGGAAKRVAYLLSGQDSDVRQAVLCLVASWRERNKEPRFPASVGEIQGQLEALNALALQPRPERKKHAVAARVALQHAGRPPLEAARAVPILEVFAREGVGPGKRVGAAYLFRCPFHDDKRPSLRVEPEGAMRGRWRCFVCNVGGDSIAFVQQLRGLSFPDAVRRIAA